MGMLPLITPYLEEVYKAQTKIEELEEKLATFQVPQNAASSPKIKKATA